MRRSKWMLTAVVVILGGIIGLRFFHPDGNLETASTEPAVRVRAHLDQLIASSRAPGIQYVIVDSVRTLLNFAGGLADIRSKRAVDSATTMMAYSMSKTITAAGILRLAATGRLSLDDPIDRYVPGVPYGPEVTIRRLLSHSAGIPSPLPMRWVHLTSMHASFDEPAALAAVLRQNAELASTPGSRFKYSNIGYWLLGPVIERVTGQPFSAFVENEILAPLDIDPRQLGYLASDPERHATGYLAKFSLMNLMKGFLIDDEFVGAYDGRWLRINTHYVNGPAFGGLVGTASALSLFLQDQLRAESRILPGDGRALFYQQQRVASGDTIPMTLGWHVGFLDGERYYYKEGGGGGFHSMMRLYPERGIGSVIIANATTFNVARELNRMDAQFFGRNVSR